MLKLRKSKTQKGITLIALIITIVVLLILAAVAISSITNDGILQYAQNAATDYNQAVKNEQDILQGYLNFLENGGSENDNEDESTGGEGSGAGDGSGNGSGTTQTVATVKNTVLSTTSNTDVYDAYGNKIVVPAGFKIRVDDTTNNADTVTEGIVIEHGTDGNQFVWIPVGKIYTDTAKTESLAKTITLGRYSSFTATDGVYTPAQTASNYATATTINSYYTEDTSSNHNSSYGNSIARNIGDFVTSATQKGGYYLGRYEAGDSSNTAVANRTGSTGTSTAGTLVCKANQVPYNWILQSDASSKCQSMYADGYSSGTFSSDLINSYAWDTAIVFLQTFDNRADKTTPYSRQNSLNSSLSLTGTTTDVICNIYDMASNCYEWSTEAYSSTNYPCVPRGGSFVSSYYYASYRNCSSTSYASDGSAFRPLLYVGL